MKGLHVQYIQTIARELKCSNLVEKLQKTEFSVAFALQLTEVITQISKQFSCYSRSYLAVVMSRIRRLLASYKVAPQLIALFRLPSLENNWNPMMHKKYGILNQDHPVRQRLENWLKILCEHYSESSIRTIMYFYIHRVLPKLELDLEHWPNDTSNIKCTPELMQEICGSKTLIYSSALQFFFTRILSSPIIFPKLKRKRKPEDEDGDRHRISKEDLEILYRVAQKKIEDEMMFLLLLTTGMRIGGFKNLKIKKVAQIMNGSYIINEIGETIEKGRKLFRFKIHPKIQVLLADWLNNKRGFHSSEYVFPGLKRCQRSNQHFQERWRAMCQVANLKGLQFHLHALRHTHAHILFELGNSVDIISKLMNHESSKTTRKYYLKETVEDVYKRAIIPWMPNKAQITEDPVPSFLESFQKSENALSNVESHKRLQLFNSKDV